MAQLWAPLQFLGFYIRQARQALVDLEEARQLLTQPVSALETAELSRCLLKYCSCLSDVLCGFSRV